ncbi:MAG TPA: hypothetical protein DCS84_09195 [Microbacterium sp.]|nr:hypothetical protein [Microbacterium sp.]
MDRRHEHRGRDPRRGCHGSDERRRLLRRRGARSRLRRRRVVRDRHARGARCRRPDAGVDDARRVRRGA